MSATAAPAGRLTPITADTVLVDIERSSLQGLAAGHDLLTQARMVPSLHQGRVQGPRFYAVRPGSLFAALGVRNGDTMLSVNGRSMSRLECVPELLTELFGDPPGFLDIQLVRGGQPLRVVVLVHQRPHAGEAEPAPASAGAPSRR
jgi:type II secretory pathway component PulC